MPAGPMGFKNCLIIKISSRTTSDKYFRSDIRITMVNLFFSSYWFHIRSRLCNHIVLEESRKMTRNRYFFCDLQVRYAIHSHAFLNWDFKKVLFDKRIILRCTIRKMKKLNRWHLSFRLYLALWISWKIFSFIIILLGAGFQFKVILNDRDCESPLSIYDIRFWIFSWLHAVVKCKLTIDLILCLLTACFFWLNKTSCYQIYFVNFWGC